MAADALPVLANVPVADVATEHVLRVLQPIWLAKHKSARRLRQRIEAVLDFATALRWRNGENPARWRGHLEHLLGKPGRGEQPHHAAMRWQDIPAFMARLKQQRGMAALAMRFAILTAGRSGEVLGAQWSEIDHEAKVWTVPASRMKGRRVHVVPLSAAAQNVLREIEPGRVGNLVFAGRRQTVQLHDRALWGALRQMGVLGASVHGFRTSFRTWVAEQTTQPREVAEAALAHRVENATEAAYFRTTMLERRRNLMEHWGQFCTGQGTPGKVVPLRRAG
jgi:integrase